MNKIPIGSVFKSAAGHHYLITSHKKSTIRAQNEEKQNVTIYEGEIERGKIIPGKDSMDIIKKYWF